MSMSFTEALELQREWLEQEAAEEAEACHE
jgi:hypothetical protein